MKIITMRAHAKINLGLSVLGQRDDGYHDLCTIMQSISLYDRLTIERTDTPGITITCSAPGLPVDERNLCYKAAKVLLGKRGCLESMGVRITLEKRIPMQAGMGGGSTDGAATLVGVNEVCGLGFSQKALREIGASLGADVPFCIQGGTALCEGIGERMTPLPALPHCWILIVKPEDVVSTKEAYGGILPVEMREVIDMAPAVEAIKEGSLEKLAGNLENDFEPGISKEHPQVAHIRKALEQEGCLVSRMTGSGPTVFGIFLEKEQVEKAYQKLKEAFPTAFVAVSEPMGESLVVEMA